MTTKRYLPILILVFASLAVSAGALGLVWILAVDAKTMGEKMQVSLSLGIPAALVLIVLLWFGAGLDHVLARLKNTSMRVSVSLFTYLLVPAGLCIGLPVAAAFLIYAGFSAPQGWRQLPAPPEPAVEVAGAGELHVIIRTDSGAYFQCSVGSPADGWTASAKPEQRMTGRGTEITTPPASSPPQDVVSLVGLSYSDLGEEGQVHYAVLRDGTVWYLQTDTNQYEAGFASGLFLTLAAIPAITGLLVIYLGAGVSALARWLAK